MPQCAKILFVDDDCSVLDSLRRSLGRCYDLVTARGPEEGLCALAEKGPFAVIVSDLRMPGLSGLEFLRRAKEIAPQSVAIMLTGHGDLDTAMAAINEGHIFRFLTKPCPPPILSRSLDAAITQYRLAAADRELLRMTLENARLKDDVERIMRHDLKTPLTTIISLPQVLRMAENLDGDQRDMLSLIEDAGYTVLAMVNLSAALFKMERDEYVLDPVAVDLVPIVGKLFAAHADRAETHDLALELTLDGRPAAAGDGCLIRGEELLCYSMLANLLANAVEASPDGARVAVEMRQDGAVTTIAIANQGAVPSSVRDRFFEKYATAGKSKGTGLGTYSARRIALVHGGDIAMTTSEAEGTVVTVSLPRAGGPSGNTGNPDHGDAA
jgi:signal transduction histidine kinase